MEGKFENMFWGASWEYKCENDGWEADGCVGVWMGRWEDESGSRWMKGWMDGWMDG